MYSRAIGAGIAGGLVGGAVVGASEAIVAWATGFGGGGALPPVGWAVIVYGLIGASAGFGAGTVAAVVGTDGFGLGLAGVTAAMGFVVARFRIVRDVFLEQLPPGTLPKVIQLGALLATIVLGVVVWRGLRGADARRGFFTRPVLVAVLIGLLGGVWHAVESTMPAEPPAVAVTRGTASPGAPNVILFMMDTLRADHLGAWGYKAVRTPNLDALASDGVRFSSAYAQASWTRPSVATILTGLYPSSHGAVHKADLLPDRVDTLAEMLARGGYYTAGFPNNVNVSPAFNFGQGFAEFEYLAPDLFFEANEAAAQLTLYNGLRLVRERFFARRVDVHNYYQPGEVVAERVRGWLDAPAAKQGPFFLFVHMMDAHDPYMAHPYDGEGYARVANPNPPASLAEKYRQLYDGEIAHLDQNVGAIIEDLKRRGLYDKTLIIVSADHGEEFFEHGGWWHGTTLYDEQIHVPLIMKPAAGGARGRVVDALATNLDIVPTVLTAAKLAVPNTLQGHALPLDDAEAPARESVFAEEDLEGNVLQALRGRHWKMITANPGNPRGLEPEAVYDLASDAGETKNLASQQPQKVEELRAGLGRAFLAARAQAGAGAQTDVDSVTKDRLRALGYLE